jgi:hypothetical protein
MNESGRRQSPRTVGACRAPGRFEPGRTLRLAAAAFAAATWLLACGPSAASEDGLSAAARRWVEAEGERLAVLAGDPSGEADEAGAELAAIAEEAAAGRPLRALSRTVAARLRIEPAAWSRERAETIADLEALEREAAAVGADVDRFAERVRGAGESVPELFRALAESLLVKAQAYRSAAVPYARVDSIESGRYYLGAARASAATAAELASLPVEGEAPAPPPAGLTTALDDLDRRAIEAYRVPGAEVERHSDFINLNARIKEARDLLTDGASRGALYAYLDARRRLEEIVAGAGQAPPGAGAPDRTALEVALRTWRGRCAGASWDTSLGRLYVESAEAELVGDPAALGRARILLEVVLPEYFALHEETS